MGIYGLLVGLAGADLDADAPGSLNVGVCDPMCRLCRLTKRGRPEPLGASAADVRLVNGPPWETRSVSRAEPDSKLSAHRWEAGPGCSDSGRGRFAVWRVVNG